MSADTIVPGYTNPQNLNRYSYVTNNPLRYIDPSGHAMLENEFGGGCSTSGYCGGSSNSNNDDDDEDSGGGNDRSDEDCSWGGVLGGGGCNPQYYSVALGLDAPTIMMLSGLGISLFDPELGLPLTLSGAVFEACAFTATPLCAAVKLASLNLTVTLDKDGNLYLGPQISWGKSILPFGAISFNAGMYATENGHIATEAEMEDSLQGFSVSAGTISTGGVSYSPLASENNTAYYLVGAPEIFSVNVQYNWLLYDFSL